MKRTIQITTIFICFLLLFWNCAKRGTPDGGDKDETPPVLLRANPKNGSVNFNTKKIKLTFDEYVVLKDVQKQLVISPPLKYPPELIPQGLTSKTIEIRIKDTLKPNTTYSFSFGQSIQDNNEGNPLSFFKYVLSTGSYIDSLELKGFLTDAIKEEVDNFVSVMLYKSDSTFTDSTIYKKPPMYITNTLDSLTTFHFKNLKSGAYKLIALRDAAKNNKFDPRSDKIAYLETDVLIPNDTVYGLNMFMEMLPYTAKRPKMVRKNRIEFGFEGNFKDAKIRLLDRLPDSVKTVYLKDREKDTVHLWFTPLPLDSLQFVVLHPKFQQKDTFTVRKANLKQVDSMTITAVPNRTLELLDTLKLRSNTPIAAIDSTKILLVEQDSIPMEFEQLYEPNRNELQFYFKKKSNQSYSLQLLPGALKDMFETPNDTLTYRLSTRELSAYGSIDLNLKNIQSYPVIVQLTDMQYKVERTTILKKETPFVRFKYLLPKEYRVRLIYDTNENGRWDTGSYKKNTQPETIEYLKKIIDLRANWDYEETFNSQQ